MLTVFGQSLLSTQLAQISFVFLRQEILFNKPSVECEASRVGRLKNDGVGIATRHLFDTQLALESVGPPLRLTAISDLIFVALALLLFEAVVED